MGLGWPIGPGFVGLECPVGHGVLVWGSQQGPEYPEYRVSSFPGAPQCRFIFPSSPHILLLLKQLLEGAFTCCPLSGERKSPWGGRKLQIPPHASPQQLLLQCSGTLQ